MQVNTKRGFNRLFVVLTAIWIVYCLFVYPMQQRVETDGIHKDELRHCYQDELGKGSEHLSDCLKYAQLKSGIDMWSLKAFYARESWVLALVVTVVPLLAYGFCRGTAALGLWVWRGFRQME